VVQTLATLGPGDLLIRPDLEGVTAADFALHRTAAERGRVAAEALAPQLAALSVGEPAWAAWQRRVAVRERAVAQIDEVQVTGLLRVDEALVRRQIEQQPGQPLDTARLARDLGRAFGDGHYEWLDYSVLRTGGRQVLRVHPVEKSWGPDYLRLGVQLESNLSQGSSYQLRAGYQRTWLNRLGAELLVAGELGSTSGVSAELYQPLNTTHDAFVELQGEYRRERADYWIAEQRVAEYRIARHRIDLTAGLNLPRLGQLRAGWRNTRAKADLETGLDIFSFVPRHDDEGALVALEMDRLDRLYFPRSGWALRGSWFRSHALGYTRAAAELRAAVPVQQWVLAGRASWVGSPQGDLPVAEAGRLGGFLSLTGFANGQLLGDDVLYGHLRAERIVGRAPLGLRGDMRVGVALEAGRVGTPYTLQKKDGWLNSVALYLGGETSFGSVYLGLGRGSGGAFNAYLFIGTP
jgi:NTE family protein